MESLHQGLPTFTSLQSLDVSRNQISDKGMENLRQGLPTLTSVQSLDVSGIRSVMLQF